jgi:pimeloyl-ACP methyl ester carboxylesterase
MSTRPLLCLLHAFPLCGDLFRDQREALADIADVFTPDLPGFGGSAPLVPSTLDGMALAVSNALAKRDTGAPLILGGCSMGGATALAFARLFTARAAGLVLIDARADMDDDAGRAARDKNIALVREQGIAPLVEAMIPRLLGETTRRERPAVVEEVRRLGRAQSVAGAVAGLEALRDRPDARPHLGRIGVPVLLLYGAEDIISPPSMAAEIAAMVNGELVVLPGAGHLPSLETPEAFNAALRPFVERFNPQDT